MRHLLVLLILLGVWSLAGCTGTGFGVGVRQDKEDRDALTARLAAMRPGARFTARDLLARDWTRLFVFRPGEETQPIEDRIGVPFPFSEEATPTTSVYLVFLDGEQVVSAFSFVGPTGVDAGCLRAARGPLVPQTFLTLAPRRGRGGARLSTLATAARCG